MKKGIIFIITVGTLLAGGWYFFFGTETPQERKATEKSENQREAERDRAIIFVAEQRKQEEVKSEGPMKDGEPVKQEESAQGGSALGGKKMDPFDLIQPKATFSENFSGKETLEQGGNMNESKSPHWWVNSGAFLYFKNGVGRTIVGKLSQDDVWREKYEKYNADETDDGYHPQNIFRLITKSQWTNFTEEAYFRIVSDNLSESEHRAGSNGLLLFNRYQNGDNLYYAGIRVDGAAVIKKKKDGEYFELAYKEVFPGKYDREDQPNLIPKKKWLGLRTEVKDVPNGDVSIKLFIDKNRSGKWELVLEATDDGKKYGGKPIMGPTYAGIRTDFMDVEFDNYRIEELK